MYGQMYNPNSVFILHKNRSLLVLFSQFVQWKFAFLSLGRPEYLQDGEVVAARFQVSRVKMFLSRFCH